MRVSLGLSGRWCEGVPSRVAVLVVAMVATAWWGTGAVGAETAAGGKPAAAAKPVAKKKTGVAKSPAPVALPNGHIGQEYGTKIRGVMGIEAGDERCSDPTGLPDGLELDCMTMTIHGHPQKTVDGATVSFTVSDEDNHEVALKFTLTVLDGPDVVRAGGTVAKVGKAPPAKAPAVKTPPVRAAAPASVPVETLAPTPAVSQTRLEVEAEPVKRSPIPTNEPAARVIPASAVIATAPAAPAAPVASGASAEAIQDPDTNRHEVPGVVITIDPDTPVIEGATVIQGTVKLINSRGQLSSLCVGLKLTDTRVSATGTGVSHAALKPSSGSSCSSFETPVDKAGHFTLSMTSALFAGFVDNFEVRFFTTGEQPAIRGVSRYTISLELPEPKLKVTSLIRDGVKTISGTCDASPDPALATSTLATAPVVGNLPRVVVRLHEPGAPSYEWPAADLTVGSQTQPYQEASLTPGGGCAFSVTLKTALMPGEAIKVVLEAPPTRYYGLAQKKEVWWKNDQEGRDVFTSLAVAPPVITSQIVMGSGTITGTATPSPSGTTVSIAVVSDDDYRDQEADKRNKPLPACLTPEAMKEESGRFLPLTLSSGLGAFGTTTATGTFSVTLATPLIEGQRFHVVEILPAKSVMTQRDEADCTTTVSEVKGELDWGRIHADFTAGVLISNDSTNSTTNGAGAGAGNFSQAHQFYALTVEKSWSLPGCYLRVFGSRSVNYGFGKGHPFSEATRDRCYDWSRHELFDARKVQHLVPGVSTYFQARLTAIPVSMVASTNTTTTGTTGGAATTGSAVPAATGAGTTADNTTAAAMPTSNLLTTAQTAKVEVGAYFPFLISRWEFNHQPNALFIAPLGKVGFNTVTGASTVNTISATNTIQSQTFEQVYNFWSYGARIGHMQLTRSENRAPETFSYLDISIGPYSNLQSYICSSGTPHGGSLASGSACGQYTDLNTEVDSRKRLYRLDIEGLLKIPKTAFYLGLNANIGQKSFGTSHLDQAFSAPDDIRFFFGTKFDIANVLTKFKLTPQ